MLIIFIIVLVLLFGGGGGYYGYSRWGAGGGTGIGLGTVLVSLLVGIDGQVVEGSEPTHGDKAAMNGAPGSVEGAPEQPTLYDEAGKDGAPGSVAHDPNGVVLKVRRRRFGRLPMRACGGTITRRSGKRNRRKH